MTAHSEQQAETGYLNSISRVFATNRFLKIVLALILIVQLGDFLQLRSLQRNWEQIVVPPYAEDPYSIKMHQSSTNYLVDMSHWIVNLWGNISPNNVDDKFEILLSLFHEESFGPYQERLKAIKNEVKKYSTISHMMDLKLPDPIQVIDNTIIIRIKRYRIVGQTIKPPVEGTLKIIYTVEGGRFKIIELEEAQ